MRRILFGDNQFYGVNHMSEEKARAQLMRFKDLDAIMEVLDFAYNAGIQTFMCTTHDQIAAVCDRVRANPDRYREFEFYPCMPYAHKYANAVSQFGMAEALKKFSSTGDGAGAVGVLAKGAFSAIQGNVFDLAKLLVDAEMKSFRGLRTPVVFLQNVVTDLLLGLGLDEAFLWFHNYVRERYDAEAGFITMNLPSLLDVLDKLGIANPIVCANINKIGFRMSGGRELYEQTLATRKFRPIAMSIFASGAIPAEEAVRYVCSQESIHSIVFGASSRSNIEKTKTLIDKYTNSYMPRVGAL